MTSPMQQSSRLSTGAKGALGGAATGATLGSIVPGVGTAIGAGVGAAAGALSGQFGRGRKAADSFVDAVENPFGQQLAQISQLSATDPATAKQQLDSAYQNYQSQANAEIARGGNQAKVAQQSLQNQALQQTVQRLYAQLGGQR